MVFKKPTSGVKKPVHFNKQARVAEADPNAFRKMRTPYRKDLEQYGKVIQLMGSNQVKIACEDAQDRICRIPGKLFKHVWLKANDIVIVKLWDFQLTKADVIWRYQGFQKNYLEKRGELTKLYEYTHDEISRAPERPIYQERPKVEERPADDYEFIESDGGEIEIEEQE